MHLNHYVLTLANSIIGVGILAMPYCFQKCGVVLSILLLASSNLITRSCCHFLIKSSLLTRRKSIEFLALHTFGASGKLFVELMIIGYMIGTCVAYFVVLGDLGPQILSAWFHFEHGHNIREWLMVVVTLFCILPLGMLKNVDSLASVCTASIAFYFCLVIKIIFESEHHIVKNDWEDQIVYWRPAGLLQCLPIFSMALSCQMQVFEVFKSITNQSLEKLNDIVKSALTICSVVYISCGFFGYVAFCGKEFSGNILTVFSPTFASDVIRIGFLLSVCFSFPLVIFPCRASIFSFMYKKDSSHFIPEGPFRGITIFIIAVSLILALLIPSIELVIGLVGSTIGIAICIMFPAACYKRIIKKESREKNLAQIILAGGFILMVLGTYANLNAIDEKRSGAHLASTIEVNSKPQPLLTLDSFKEHQEDQPVIVVKNVSNERKKFSPVSPQPEPEHVVNAKQSVVKETKNEAEKHKKMDEQKDLELKKTQDELKITKELLEKKVGQLKEAQDLVVEKLGEVVDKVEEIAKEIKDEQDEEKTVKVVKEVPKVEDILLKVQEIKKTIDVEKSANETVVIPKNTLLLNRLTKNGSKSGMEAPDLKRNEKKEEHFKIGDDGKKLERKVEEKIEDKSVLKEKKSIMAKPIPLAVLINSSKVESPVGTVKNVEPPVVVKNETVLVEDIKTANIEAIRRDLLEEKETDDPPTKVKRSLGETEENCTKKRSIKHFDET